MIVCVAEKPSVGQEIARVLGANRRCDGYFEGNGYCVTWGFGHLCALLEPQEYTDQWKGWNLSSLPMIPPRFSIKVSGDAGVQKQFGIIKSLIAQAEMVINCGDAGQEGELIQRWIYQKAECKVPVKRLWISSMTEEALREGFKSLRDQSEYQKLYEAGLMRAIGDWLLGMNATRAYTIRYAKGTGKDRQVLSVGRVQTPTLALIVQREEEIMNFKPKTYWELKTRYREAIFTAQIPVEEDEYAITTLPQGEAMVRSIEHNPLTVVSVAKKKGKESAPKLCDLTTLASDCNKRYGFTAARTLELAQSLYEKKVTTYPRVDTTYLTDDLYPKIPATLAGIKDYYPQVLPLLGLRADGKNGPGSLPKSKKVFDNKKVTDHHAIIPTGQRPEALTADERKAYDAVVQRFVGAFYPDCEVMNTTVMAEVPTTDANGVQGEAMSFKATNRQIVNMGWREVYQWVRQGENGLWQKKTEVVEETEEGEEPQQTTVFPEFKKGESGPHQPMLVERTTTPPKYYNDDTLQRAMETAGKTVDNDELREAMKENGIGRPSTRPAIIEKLIQRNYIYRKGKSLRASQVGIDLIHTIVSPLLKSAELTGRWEKKLREIEGGQYSAQLFLGELKEMTKEVVYDVKSNKAGMQCPVCKKGTIIRGRTRYGCSRWREGCGYAEPF